MLLFKNKRLNVVFMWVYRLWTAELCLSGFNLGFIGCKLCKQSDLFRIVFQNGRKRPLKAHIPTGDLIADLVDTNFMPRWLFYTRPVIEVESERHVTSSYLFMRQQHILVNTIAQNSEYNLKYWRMLSGLQTFSHDCFAGSHATYCVPSRRASNKEKKENFNTNSTYIYLPRGRQKA